jgi:hypothetical protein
MNHSLKRIIVLVVLFGLVTGCRLFVETPPPRDFTTVDLLLKPSLLPDGWMVTAEPTTDVGLDAWGMRNTISGSETELQTLNSSISHIVVLFPSSWDATRAYRDHYYTGNTVGIYATTWSLYSDFEYKSPVAKNFQVTCAQIKNVSKEFKSCAIEAQYDEFLSIILYGSRNKTNEIKNELTAIAEAIDSQMIRYLGKGNN